MENKFPTSLIVGIWFVGIGLVLNGVQSFIGTPANAQSGIQKMAICDANSATCISFTGNGRLKVNNI